MSKSTKDPAADSASKTGEIPGTGLLSKALNILECVGASDGRPRIKEIAEATGYAKPTLYRILAALTTREFVQVDPRDHAYELGPKFTELAGAVAQNSDLISISAAAMKRLAEKYGEAVSLGVLAGTAQQTIARKEGLGVAVAGTIGARKPLYCTSLGKALLAWQPEAVLAALLDDLTYEPLTEHTHRGAAALRADLAAVRMRGFALDNEEIVPGAKCVAVPILAPDGVAIAALSVSAPAHRMADSRRQDIAIELQSAAREISGALAESAPGNYRGPDLPEWLAPLSGLSTFATVQLFDGPGGTPLACDGPGAALLNATDGAPLSSFSAPLRAACHPGAGDVVLAIAGSTLWRVDLSQPGEDGTHAATRLADAPELAEVDGLVAVDGTLYAAAGPRILKLDTDGRCTPLHARRRPGSGLKTRDGTLVFATDDGLAALDPSTGTERLIVPLDPAGLADFALAPGGRVWLARHDAWGLDMLAGTAAPVHLPLPVPTASALHIDAAGTLRIGTARLSLSSAQLDLAPLAGSLFTVDAARAPLP
ncbi:helix-turn-helix domain-containing protein [Oceanicola sp. D3]|uniref:IclR family transcriptional regulator domain-containing protein n=1 Tax=Oceanicola sp. D3 TaxID=2587163 RepID=UPI00111F8465|nr:IclR family transcriptional regulator C-terminal domain-containing protein [Oceanicola sp. D3]QDC10801.1 helix-turn-helix domain-containing protein [Oceanicola sp. D3]